MKEEPLTMAHLKEAEMLIKALAPKEAPAGQFCVFGRSGLKIIKGNMLQPDTIVVSKRLFDLIYSASEESKEPTTQPK